MTRAARFESQVDWLSKHPTVVTAARIGQTFGIDPAQIVQDGDTFANLVRNAALRTHMRDEEARAKEQNRGKT